MIKLNDFWKEIIREIVENFGYEKCKIFVKKEITNIFESQNDYYMDVENFCELIKMYVDDEEKMKTIMNYSNMEYDTTGNLSLNKGNWWDIIVRPSLRKKVEYIDFIGEYIDDNDKTYDIETNSIYMTVYFITKLGRPNTCYSVRMFMMENKVPNFKNALNYED